MKIHTPQITDKDYDQSQDGTWQLWNGMNWCHNFRDRETARAFALKFKADKIAKAHWCRKRGALTYTGVESV